MNISNLKEKIPRPRYFDLLAVSILVVFFLISLSLIHSESVTTDEQAHIPAAYSYVMLDNFTLNPEHPPLAKLIGGLGFIGSHFTFPVALLHGNNKLSDRQWQVGTAFLYHSGNNPDEILMRSRLPVLVASVVGLFICYLLFASVTTKKIALLTLVFIAFSPTVLAHGHLVTTDILIMTTMTIAILWFVKYLQKPSLSYGLIAGAALALAELSKFSAALLFVFYPLATVLFLCAKKPETKPGEIIKFVVKTMAPIFVSALFILYAVYASQVIQLSHAAQDVWITQAVDDRVGNWATPLLLKLNETPPLAPVTRFVIGLASSFGRVEESHGANLLGEDYANGTVMYFPIISLLKAPTPLLILWVLMVVGIVRYVKKQKGTNPPRGLLYHARTNPVPTIGMLFTAIYFLIACSGSLDIGIRHMSPLFPWIAFVSALWIVMVMEKQTYKSIQIGKILAGGIIASFIAIALLVYPNYIPYTTEVAGGAPQAYRYYNDSNVDWGQSLKYLATYAHAHNNVLPLYVDGGDLSAMNYYFCGNADSCPKLRVLNSKQMVPRGSYFAASETELTIDWAKRDDNLAFFKNETPVAKIGGSKYLYRIP